MTEWVVRETLSRLPPVDSTLIVCFFTGRQMPDFVVPMLLQPKPPIGDVFGATFAQIREFALRHNPASHDGAVMVARGSAQEEYRIVGWSYRMYPPEGPRGSVPNKGTAYNSCFAMSQIPSVDMLYLQSRGQRLLFRFGKVFT